MRHTHHFLFASLLALGACTADDAEVDTNTSGHAIYRDSSTDHQGQPRASASPDPQDAMISIEVSGTTQLSDLEPRCSLDELSGGFTALFQGEATIDDQGLYVGGLASGDGWFETAGGCTIPPVELTSMTEVVVRAEIQATTRNCDTYCEAKARAEGEGSCGADASAATCRAAAEAEYEASCTTTCTDSTTDVIVAETSLSLVAIAELETQAATGHGLGELEVDLTFDHMKDAEGGVVADNR